MKKHNKGRYMSHFFAWFLLAFSFAAHATAPRITPQFFGEERKSDIAAYQFEPFDAAEKSDSALRTEIVREAYSAAGIAPVIDVLPSRQLANYALTSSEVVALIGAAQDIASKQDYRSVAFYLKGDEAVYLIVSKKHPRGNELYQAFNTGLQKIIKNGRYQEILGKYRVKTSADYLSRLRRHNPGWK